MAIVMVVTSSEHFTIQLVDHDYEADLLVYVTKQKYEAQGKDEIWYFEKSSADRKIKFVKYSPDLKVHYVDAKYQAGWKNKTHKLMKRIG